MFTTRTTCRVCGSRELQTVLDLGNMMVNCFPLPEDPDPESAPLDLVVCAGCSLLQLRHTVNADRLYREFHYKSGTTDTMRIALGDVVNGVKKSTSLNPGDVVVDIGSNDNTLLNIYPQMLTRVGFEPARNLVSGLQGDDIRVVNEYFSQAAYQQTRLPPAKAITAIAMLYDLDDPIRFLRDVRACLDDKGVFIAQLSYLPAMLDTNDFANICHEHLCYYSLTNLVSMFEKAGLRPFAVSFNDVNGGSVRLYASPSFHYPINDNDIDTVLQGEKRQGLHSVYAYKDFGQRVKDARAHVLDFLGEFRHRYILGASTKGNTMLQYWGLGPKEIDGAADRDASKHGKQTVTRIPIVSEQEAREKADCFLVLPWYFRNEIVDREREWLQNGGTMIFPMPLVEKYKKKTIRFDGAHNG